MNQFHLEVLIHFLSQIVDIDIDEIGARIKMGVPNLFCYFHSAHYLFCILHQINQQVVFLRRKLDRFAVSCYFLSFKIDAQVGV